jgi:hypothetical protein
MAGRGEVMTDEGNKTYRAIVGIHFDVDDEDLIDAGLEGAANPGDVLRKDLLSLTPENTGEGVVFVHGVEVV